MSKEDRQIKWKDNIGFYNGKKLFSILVFPFDDEIVLCLNLYDCPIKIRLYATLKSAKRGAERFLKHLQEVIKVDKKKPKTCDNCWLSRDFGYHIPAGYCANKCAKIYNALKD